MIKEWFQKVIVKKSIYGHSLMIETVFSEMAAVSAQSSLELMPVSSELPSVEGELSVLVVAVVVQPTKSARLISAVARSNLIFISVSFLVSK